MSRLLKNRAWPLNGIVAAALSTVLGLVFLVSPLGRGLVGWSYDSLFAFRKSVPVEGVTLLYMEPESERKLGQLRRQSWDRTVHARLLERLQEAKARAVVFDILFLPDPTDPAADARLVRAAAASGNVVVADKQTPDVFEGEVVGYQNVLPFPELRAVTFNGVSEAADEAGAIRKHYHRQDLETPSVAWRAAERTMTNRPSGGPYAPRWMNYYGPPGWLRHFNYYQAFESGEIPAEALSNQVVFVGGLYDIGFAGGKRADDFRTPDTFLTGRRSPGVEVTATAYLNLARGDWLRRLGPWTEVALTLLLGLGLGFGLTALRPMPAVAWSAGCLVVLALAVWFSTWHLGVWFPWLIGAFVQLPVAFAWATIAHTTGLQREKRLLEQTLFMTQAGQPATETAVLPAARAAAEAEAHRVLSPTPVRYGSSARSDAPARTVEQQATVAAGPDDRPAVPDHELLRCIGKGAYGEVWLARDIIGTFHAVKVVYRKSFRDAVPFDREFNGIRRFTPISRSHPGFVHILHVGRNERGDYLYCVMELGDDEQTGQQIVPETYSPKTLARELRRRGRLPLVECLPICMALADALQHLHDHQLIHRDIKPSNIIFVKGAPKFADIGLVTELASDTRDVSYLGTHGYIAPEGPGTTAADVYSLGKLIYEAGFGVDAGRYPELPTTLVENPEASGLFALNRILLKACQNDVRQRYQSAAELRVALAALQQIVIARPGCSTS